MAPVTRTTGQKRTCPESSGEERTRTDKDTRSIRACPVSGARPKPVEVLKVERTEGVLSIGMSQADSDRFEETLGTNSLDFAYALMAQVGNVVPNYSKTSDINATLAAFNGMALQNELQAMLAAQMVGTHALAMEFARRSTGQLEKGNADLAERYFNLASKASRTFVAQTEALSRAQGGSKQTVEVKHVHVSAHNAIVGDVNHG